MTTKKASPEGALVLRTCDANLRSFEGFQWPESGPVECHDWDPEPECGGGLHGLLWGEGEGNLLSWEADAKWLVVEVDADAIVDLGGKVKFPRGVVVYCGDRKDATDFIVDLAPEKNVAGAIRVAGDHGTSTVGYRGTATVGNGGTAKAGFEGTATAGEGGTATVGEGGTTTVGDHGTATAGYRGTATAGVGGTATAGYRGTATAGDRGTATAGDEGTAMAGYRGTATAGDGGRLQIEYWDNKVGRFRLAVAYVGEDGIKPNTPYRVDDKGRFFEVER